MKTKQELLEDWIKMRESGRNYRSLLHYLDANCKDETIIQNTISAIRELENNGDLKVIPIVSQHEKLPRSNILMGAIFLIMGFGLMFFLWSEGFFSTMSIILIGIIFLALTGTHARKSNQNPILSKSRNRFSKIGRFLGRPYTTRWSNVDRLEKGHYRKIESR